METPRTQACRPTALTVLAAVLALAIPSLSAAQVAGQGRRPAGPLGPMMRGGGPLAELRLGLQQLGLSDAQREQVKSILEARRTEMTAVAKRLRDARKALHEATIAESLDESVIRTAGAALAEAETDAALLRAKVHQEVWSLLTPEQRETAKKLRADRQTRLEERRQRMQQRLKQRQPAPRQ